MTLKNILLLITSNEPNQSMKPTALLPHFHKASSDVRVSPTVKRNVLVLPGESHVRLCDQAAEDLNQTLQPTASRRFDLLFMISFPFLAASRALARGG